MYGLFVLGLRRRTAPNRTQQRDIITAPKQFSCELSYRSRRYVGVTGCLSRPVGTGHPDKSAPTKRAMSILSIPTLKLKVALATESRLTLKAAIV